jgi:uncharacterized protein YoxC
MNRRQIIFVIILTAVVAISLSVLIVTTINDVNDLIEQECFDKLEDTTQFLAKEIKSIMPPHCQDNFSAFLS